MQDFTQCKILDITRTGINGLHFYLMQPEELKSAIVVIKQQIANYKPSISGICISDQERQCERWSALRNAEYNLRMKTSEQSGA
jgi:hypothetical protein